MLAWINSFFQILTITIGTFMIERYVLLEPPMEPKKQRIFYIISFCSVMAAFPVLNENAQYLSLVFGGLNILLGRKKYRLAGFFMVIPLIGIMNGVASPIFLVPYVLRMSEDEPEVQAGCFIIYIVIMALLALFYFKGKKWREWFSENMKNRRPRLSEYVLVIISGIVITFFSNYCKKLAAKTSEAYPELLNTTSNFVIVFEIITFILTITIIVMIMQGNRRKFYYDKVEKMQFSIIATMADIVENRDENTGGHIKRTAKYVEIIGNKLRSEGAFAETLTEQYLADMIVAAPLHDIGKIHIPDAILNKPGKLTDEEFAIMKTHTTAGHDVLLKAQSQLGEFDYLNTAVEMAEFHHERWDGKGYPNGISGNEIPLCARIMAVADVFDALTAKRCYKEAMPVEKAYGIIEEETGSHFDPEVAKAFLESKEEVERTIKETAEDQ